MIFETKRLEPEAYNLIIGKQIVGFGIHRTETPNLFYIVLLDEKINSYLTIIIQFKILEFEIAPYLSFQIGSDTPQKSSLLFGFTPEENDILKGHIGHNLDNFEIHNLEKDKTYDILIDSQYTGFRGMRSIRIETNSFAEAIENQEIGLNWSTIY